MLGYFIIPSKQTLFDDCCDRSIAGQIISRNTKGAHGWDDSTKCGVCTSSATNSNHILYTCIHMY